MVSKRKTLGRGLDALLGVGQPAAERAAAAESAEPTKPAEPAGGGMRAAASDGELRRLPVEALQRGRYQPRMDMRQETLEELARSIATQGIVQPLVVRPIEPAASGARFEIIAGERRWRAAQLAGLPDVPVLVREVPDEAAVALALIENIQREDLNPLEEALALKRLVEEFDLTHQAAAEAVGRSRAAVSNLLRLLELADEVKGMVERRELEMGHARALLALPAVQQVAAARRVVQQGLTVRATEKLVRRLLEEGDAQARPSRTPPEPDPDIRRLEAELSDSLGARVNVQHGGGGAGRLVISYHSLDELEGILEHIRRPSN